MDSLFHIDTIGKVFDKHFPGGQAQVPALKDWINKTQV